MTAWRKTTSSPTWQFVILIIVVTFTGLSQGLLLPLLTIFLERMGVPSDLNALNATALYIGVFGMMFLVERILMKVGFKRMILGGCWSYRQHWRFFQSCKTYGCGSCSGSWSE